MGVNHVDYFGSTLMDISDSTVNSETLADGVTAYGADGEKIVGTMKPVLYTPQTLTEEQKAQARANIGADKSLMLTEGEPQIVVVSDNLYNPAEAETGGFYQYTNGVWTASANFCSTGFIPCKAGDVLCAAQNGGAYHLGGNLTCYDASYNFVVGIDVTVSNNGQSQTPFTIPDNEAICYFRISFPIYAYNADYYQINKDTVKAYDSYAIETVNTTSGYFSEYNVLAPNITAIEENVDKALVLTESDPQIVVVSDNLYNPEEVETGGYYIYTTGAWIERSDISSTGLIPCKPGDVFYASYNDAKYSIGGNLTCYDENHNFVAGADVQCLDNTVLAPINIPNNEAIRYFRISLRTELYNSGIYQINKDEVKPYDEYAVEIIKNSAYYSEHDVIAPNITILEEKIANPNLLYFGQTYSNEVTILYKRSKEFGTTYWLFIVNDKKFDGSTIKPVLVGTDASNPLGGTATTNVSSFALKGNYLHVINGGIFLTDPNEADGITIIDGTILKSTGVEQFNVEQYVLGIDASGNFKTYRNETAANILADGSIHAVTGFVPLIEDGEAVANSVLSVCPHYHIKHPRQIIGRLKDGKYFTFACDGRTDGEAGMTLAECIKTITADLPVEFAFNLDGGGSTQSTVGKKLVNRMLDNRVIPNVIVFA